MDDLTLIRQTTSTATAYGFRFKWGWAIFTINDSTGELSVCSDWGSYSHRWNVGALGSEPGGATSTLTQFLARCCRQRDDYVVRKLKLDSRSKCLEEVFDADGTMRGVRRRVCEYRREQRITKPEARALWQLAAEWVRHEDGCTYDTCPDQLCRFLNGTIDAVYEYIETKPSARFVFLRDRLIPFFGEWLRANVIGAPAPAQAVANG